MSISQTNKPYPEEGRDSKNQFWLTRKRECVSKRERERERERWNEKLKEKQRESVREVERMRAIYTVSQRERERERALVHFSLYVYINYC